MADLCEVVRTRRSIRLYHTDRPVPREPVIEALELAMRAPSSANGQPWHLVLVSGAARQRLVENLLEAARTRRPEIPPCPAALQDDHFALGAQVYGSFGVAREDHEARRKAQLFGWQFYGAPLGGIVCMRRELRHIDSIGVGAFLQTFLLALTERGLGTCVEMLIAGFPDVIRRTLKIADEYEILCGVAIGYPVVELPANNLHIPRHSLDRNVVFIDH
ncbi:MAG: nitroreductase [Nevskiaceae bacterium]|nr:MAG: nitroreductase [Nevskiaceae bacterium]TBR74274.1 MAG: nitroreductase [Nevskiaceae bacterium]